MTLLLAAAVLLLQDRAADEAFSKIEDAVEKAKTLRVKFKVELDEGHGGEIVASVDVPLRVD